MAEKDIYREFCKTAEDLPIFFYDWYLDGACDDETWDVVSVERKGEPIAFLPYLLKKKLSFNYITFPSFIKYLGPYIIPQYREIKYEHEIQKELIEKLPNVASFKQNFSPLITNWLPFLWKGFKQTTQYTYQIEGLNEIDNVYNSFNRNIKRNILKAESQLEVKEDLPLEDFYAIHKKSFIRQGIPIPYTLGYLKKYDEILKRNNAGKNFYAHDEEGRIHSVSYIVWDKKNAYYHLSGDDPELRDSGSGILLIWKAIEYASQVHKLDIFDFEGSMMPNIEKIRVQFGAKQVPYFFVWKYNSNLFWLMESLQSLLKRKKSSF